MRADLVCAEQGSCVQIQIPGICRAESPVLNPLLYPVLQQQRAGLVSGGELQSRHMKPNCFDSKLCEPSMQTQ